MKVASIEAGAPKIIVPLPPVERSTFIYATSGHVFANRGDALTVQRVPQSGSWRIAFVVTPRPKKPVVDLHCYLTLYGEVLTETWVYQWSP